MSRTFEEDVNSSLDSISHSLSADVLVYAGAINRVGASRIMQALRRKRHRNLMMLLCTTGGDSHAAFKIARACQAAYNTVVEGYKQPGNPKWSVYVPTVCKSAGTIIALGADEVVMGIDSELGPIDIQTRKPEEVGELTPTLTPVQAMQSLQRQASDVFVHIFSALRFDEKISFSTKMAGEFSKDLSAAIIGPIAQQIDPMRLAETERLLKISSEYGERLNLGVGNLKDDALSRLLSSYPSHGFVIDRREAESLFKQVIRPPDPVYELGVALRFLYVNAAAQEEPIVHMVERFDDAAQSSAETDSQNRSRASNEDGVAGDGEGQSQVRTSYEGPHARKSKGAGQAK